MNTEKLAFIQHKFTSLLKDLDADATGKWGKMNAQQMVEHVTAFFKVSTGKIKFPLAVPEEHLPKYREFLLSDKQFRENTKAPETVLGEEPMPLRNPDMETALLKLQDSIDEFVDHFREDPATLTMHPVFGNLNFEEWILLHYKHLTHHARQFGLVQ